MSKIVNVRSPLPPYFQHSQPISLLASLICTLVDSSLETKRTVVVPLLLLLFYFINSERKFSFVRMYVQGHTSLKQFILLQEVLRMYVNYSSSAESVPQMFFHGHPAY